MSGRLLAGLLLAFSTLGCSGGESDRSMIARVDTIAGNRVEVVNTGRSPWTPDAAWRLEEDLRLGSSDGGDADPEQFGQIASIVSDSRGRIYVLDSMAQEVRVFRSDGTFSHTIGGKGAGPGEFEFATLMTLGRGDTLVVTDDGAMRYSVFAPNGTLVETHRRSIVGTTSSIFGTVLPDGSYLDWAPVSPDGRFGPRFHVVPIRYGPRFERPDTFPPLEYTWEMLPSGMPQTYFSGAVVGAAGADGSVWFARSEEYRIHRRSLEGDTSLVFSLPAQPVRLGEEERAGLRDDLSHVPDLLAEILEALPETLPVIYRIVPDDAGHIFVLPRVAGEAEGSVVDVFEESGTYIGRMTLPARVSLRSRSDPVAYATAEYLLVVTTDELDVPYVVRFRIVRER